MESKILPYYEYGSLHDGKLFPAPRYCRNRLRKEKKSCIEFHSDVFNEGKFVTCPEGYRAIMLDDVFYCGLVTERTNIKKMLSKSGGSNVLALSETGILHILNTASINREVSNALNDTLHDVKKLNGYMLDIIGNLNLEEYDEDLRDKFETIKQWNYLMKSRLSLYDLSQSSFLLDQGRKVEKDVFRLFDAIKRSFESIQNDTGGVIRIKSNGRIDAVVEVYNSFQLLPFVLLDNAIKYAPKNCTIDIVFDLKKEYLEVRISSMGPKPNPEDNGRLEERGYRSQSNLIQKTHGSGLGLSIADEICRKNDISFSYSFDDVPGNNKLCMFNNVIRINRSLFV